MDKHRISHHLALRPRRGATHHTVGELGFTIIEIIVSVAVLGVIVVPMALAFSAGFRVSEVTGASLNASASRDQLAFRFTNDVASVDATGASRSGATCDTSPSGGGTLLITLNSTTQPSATAISTRVSYWVTGNGVNINVERRSCANATPGVAATNGVSAILAEKVGYQGAVGADTVHGPYDPALGAMGSPCNEFRCQLEIDGRYRYRVTAQRRAFGAGVPLEIGKIYGSSATRQRDNTMLYEHTTGAGISRGVEQRFTDQITLAGGLDGPPLLYAEFAVQQKLTGKWLACPSSDFTTCSFSASSKTFVTGQYSSNVWRLPLRVGPGEVMAAGGEYRVYTQLKAGASAPPKVYGGSNGFPMWVDWYPEDSVFVKPAANGGNDASDGLTPATAVATIDRALRVSASANRGEIQVGVGNYAESIVVSGASYADNRTMTGAHDVTNWMRGTKLPIQSKVTGANPATTGIGYRITAKKLQKFRQMGIQSGAPASAPGSSAWGLVIDGGATVMLDYSQVLSSPGRAGAPGTNAQPKGDACSGWSGIGASRSPVVGWSSGSPRTLTWNGQPYIAYPAACLAPNAQSARSAGYGGGGGNGAFLRADPGADGGPGGGSQPAAGGRGGTQAFCDGRVGGPGRGGVNDANPGNGGVPSAAPSWTPLSYAGVSGGAGSAGLDGHGGSGAGGASATNCFVTWADGSSGGAGGQGGVGGAAGGGGGYGGASVAVFVDGSGSTVRIQGGQILSGGGGAGGNGGRGGDGGYGGVGGRGGSNSSLIGENSGGGGGGSGGNGGGGGAAGQGGIAFNALTRGGGVVRINDIVGVKPAAGPNGTPGEGGAGGAGGAGGLGGSSSLTVFWIFTINFGAPSGANGSQGRPGSAGASPPDPTGCHQGGVSGSTYSCSILGA